MITIEGVEFTQSIQTYRSPFPVCGTNRSVPCPDNSVPIVAGKPMAIRIYLGGSLPDSNIRTLRARAMFSPVASSQRPEEHSSLSSGSVVGNPNRLDQAKILRAYP